MSCQEFDINFLFSIWTVLTSTRRNLLWVSLCLADIFLMSPSRRGNAMIKWEYFTIGKTQSINKVNGLNTFLGRTRQSESADLSGDGIAESRLSMMVLNTPIFFKVQFAINFSKIRWMWLLYFSVLWFHDIKKAKRMSLFVF